MADNAEAGSDAQITFKVKPLSEKVYTIEMPESTSVLELKTKLAGADFENVPVERQRLIYAGRVMKNEETLATYKIKPNNTIHMVKSAASNQTQPASSNGSAAPQTLPTNMASGTANNPLANLTSARYAGHQLNLPGLDSFGPDGGMGPPMDDERMARLMSDPNVQQSMNEALNNPDFVNMLIDSNPMLRNMPNARELITSPFMREMMSNPAMLSGAMRMQRGMRGGESAFPAPGATDTTPENTTPQNPADAPRDGAQPERPWMPTLFAPGVHIPPFLTEMEQGLMNMGMDPNASSAAILEMIAQGANQGGAGTTGAGTTGAGATGTGTTGAGTTGAGTTGAGAPPGTGPGAGANARNPFAALFPGAAGGAVPGGSPFQMTPEQLQAVTRMLQGNAAGAPAAPADTRPPEERYEEQLRQLNDMGFFDFDRNVAALRRSGGSVHGAIEYLLSG
ncbi:deubiquitination-protection protein dph1 [Cordyceps fumosorosea ARSEF 2679]|uniref:Deubiquitination-protection protein dph1 n=1 Tax=Cordyceps fumosorosea (strain ARSEF 2679) TaxID=1081104 RepID=A0A167V151_CORFA|nr:deubiquitination-protection protein dph1 [Cordyceps fumosorosea ARSEF 2679]OAA62113.1 deubiquitination-protection protein dph1 [Cordyceps fumosorosea ARSEF 2679]